MSNCNHMGTQAEPCHICAKDEELSSLRGSCKALGAENKQLKHSAKKAAREFDTLAQRLQEAEGLLAHANSCLPSTYAYALELSEKIDAFLAGKQ